MNEKDWKKEWEALYAQFIEQDKKGKSEHHSDKQRCKENKEKK